MSPPVRLVLVTYPGSKTAQTVRLAAPRAAQPGTTVYAAPEPCPILKSGDISTVITENNGTRQVEYVVPYVLGRNAARHPIEVSALRALIGAKPDPAIRVCSAKATSRQGTNHRLNLVYREAEHTGAHALLLGIVEVSNAQHKQQAKKDEPSVVADAKAELLRQYNDFDNVVKQMVLKSLKPYAVEKGSAYGTQDYSFEPSMYHFLTAAELTPVQ